MYLTRGEANLRKGGAPIGSVDPLDDINTVRARAGASLLADVTVMILWMRDSENLLLKATGFGR